MSNDLKFSDIKDKINNRFIHNGWVTLYKNYDSIENEHTGTFFSALINKTEISRVMNVYNWDLSIGSGRPGFEIEYSNGVQKSKYIRFYDKSIQPIVIYRSEFGNKQKYLELSEEFRLYHNLFEEYVDSNNKKYIYVDSNGDDEIVAQISENEVLVKLRFIKDYISARNMNLIIYFDVMRFSEKTMQELEINELNETITENFYIYNHLIVDIQNTPIRNDKTQSWIMGKVLIPEIANYNPNIYDNMNENNGRYEEYIIGYDENGNVETFSCDEDKLSNYFGKNPGSPNYLTPIYFSNEVLKKYYDNPNKYSVDDGRIHCTGVWILRLDNSCRDYVTVFLGDLGKLNYKEQLYWKSYNIKPEKGLSRTGFKRAFLGEPTDPDNPDLYFKMRYRIFNDRWKEKYGWFLFKPLSKNDEHYFTSFHLLTTNNNEKEFDEQILAITKIIIDSLNERELQKGISNLDDGDKGIDKFDKFLKEKGMSFEEMIKFIRYLQSLRSTSVAHRRSENNKKLNETLKYFHIGEKDLKKVLENIIIDIIKIFNTLEKHFI